MGLSETLNSLDKSEGEEDEMQNTENTNGYNRYSIGNGSNVPDNKILTIKDEQGKEYRFEKPDFECELLKVVDKNVIGYIKWEDNIYPSLGNKLDFKRFWYGALHDGVVVKNEKSNGLGNFNSGAGQNIIPLKSIDGFSLQLKESYTVRDGKFANNGWLQELPHPVSKVVWDNYAAISPSSANAIGVNTNDLVEVSNGNTSLIIPVMIQPGAVDNNITIELGYGRKNGGTVGTGIGFNSFSLLNSSSGLTPLLYSGVNVKKSTGTYNLVTSQTIYAFNEGLKRKIIQEGTVNQYYKEPDFIESKNHYSDLTVYPPIEYKGVKWGMAIDMNKCLGCGDCVVACNVENNIPVVGKEQVEKGREMHWLRVDRYYTGSPEESE